MQLPNQDHVPSRSNYAFLPCHDTAHDLQATKETVGGTISTIKVPSHTAIWIKALRKGLVVPHPQEREEAQQPVYLSWLTRRSIAATIVQLLFLIVREIIKGFRNGKASLGRGGSD